MRNAFISGFQMWKLRAKDVIGGQVRRKISCWLLCIYLFKTKSTLCNKPNATLRCIFNYCQYLKHSINYRKLHEIRRLSLNASIQYCNILHIVINCKPTPTITLVLYCDCCSISTATNRVATWCVLFIFDAILCLEWRPNRFWKTCL